MSKIFPVYQMSFSNERSLFLTKEVKFATELPDIDSQDFLHVIPVINHRGNITKLIDFLKKRIFAFPSLVNNDAVLLHGKFSYPFITFRHPESNIKIRFRVLFSQFESGMSTGSNKEQAALFRKYLLKEIRPERRNETKARVAKRRTAVELSGDRKAFLNENLLTFRYTGKSKLVLKRRYTLMALVPENIDSLTYFYNTHKLITVGMTPMFGVNEDVFVEK